MWRAPWADGVPGITQRPIQPGSTFSYEFKATNPGSHWYHAHYRGQIEDGMYGPVIVHPRKSDPKPFHLINSDQGQVEEMQRAERSVSPIVISDNIHLDSRERWELTVASGIEISCYDALLMNGKGSVKCLDPEEVKKHITPQQQALLDLIPGETFTDKS